MCVLTTSLRVIVTQGLLRRRGQAAYKARSAIAAVRSATMLLAAASYPKFCALMRQRCKAVLKERAAFDALR